MEAPRMSKTWKREVAVACLVGVFLLAFLGMLEALAILAPLTFIFATGMFGIDWASKQTKLNVPERPLRPEEPE